MPSYLVLADGTRVDAETGAVVAREVALETPHTNVTQKVNRIDGERRRIADLPDTPDRVNTIGIVLSYHMFGLTDDDIGAILGVPEGRITKLIASEPAQKMLERMLEFVREHDIDVIRKNLRRYENEAADAVGRLLRSDSESVVLAAAKDILDRGGHRPNDIVEHRHKVEGGLVIEVVKRDMMNEIPITIIEGELADGNRS